ncbi:Histidine kinase-, DNA gyrase B-, and HSP90-like ATPase [Isoptericola dokdonensis DS-3]|uniref:histidine kinase n=2 Tax=Isoptericola TaxID=254250 RepID=A0A161II23_9MICO|nr:Histidine kinase-, DNA gyrase B-, and HSP90-like ATPase [Isoptericola dokdonensis DS-3]
MVLCVAALPLLADGGWAVWAVGGAALLLPVVAAVLLARAARRDDETLRALVAERDLLARRLTETADVLERTTNDLAAEQAGRRRERAAVETAVVALSRKVQASAHRVQEEAARMVQRHSADPDVLQTSMRIDHAAAQHARQAQSLVALCGQRPGQTWDEPLPLPDVVRAAAGRITAFQRVEVSGDPGLSVSPLAVEALVHVVAELLANATQCSPPNTKVLATLRQVQRGAVIEIDDCGVGMDERELARVRRIASGAAPVTIADLGQVPQTGLAVVGTYARALDLRVDLVESVYGGLRAVVMLPAAHTEVSATGPSVLAPSVDDAWGTAPAPAAHLAPPVVARPEPPSATSVAADVVRPGPPVLPQRRSRRAALDGPPTRPTPATTTEDRADRPAPDPVADQTAEEAGAWIGAFFAAGTAPLPDPQLSEPAADTAGTSEDR